MVLLLLQVFWEGIFLFWWILFLCYLLRDIVNEVNQECIVVEYYLLKEKMIEIGRNSEVGFFVIQKVMFMYFVFYMFLFGDFYQC